MARAWPEHGPSTGLEGFTFKHSESHSDDRLGAKIMMQTEHTFGRTTGEWFTPVLDTHPIYSNLPIQTLNLNALNADIAKRNCFFGYLEYRAVGLQFRRYYLDGLDVGTAYACRPGMARINQAHLHLLDGLVSLHKLEAIQWLSLVRTDAQSLRNSQPTVAFFGEGLLEYLAQHALPASLPAHELPVGSSASTGQLERLDQAISSQTQVPQPLPQPLPQPPTTEMTLMAWSSLLKRVQNHLDHGAQTNPGQVSPGQVNLGRFNLAWRAACFHLADRFDLLDPFTAELEWDGEQLHLHATLDNGPELSTMLLEALCHMAIPVRAILESVQLQDLIAAFPNARFEQIEIRLRQLGRPA
jgi:hypothetical protein